MVFVTVGNALQGFRRLLDAVDAANERGEIDAEVIIQSGHNPDFQPRYCTAIPFMPIEEFNDLMERADLIICHGGCGPQLQAIRLGKTPVVMPRRKKYNEIISDHQLQLVRVLAAECKVIPAYEPEDLAAAVKRAKQLKQRNAFVPSPMLELVAQAIDELSAAPRRMPLRTRLVALLFGGGKDNLPSP
jgi:UDP-N-acetylglucosamine transferase subunit ALG13